MSLHEQENQYIQSYEKNETDIAQPEFITASETILAYDVSDTVHIAEVEAPASLINIADRRQNRNKHSTSRTAKPRYTVDSTTAFMNEIGRYPLLNGREEERELAIAIEAGKLATIRLSEDLDISEEEKERLEQLAATGQESKERFLVGNLRLVVSIAKNYTRPPSVDLTDVIQEGIIGLEHAIEKFDYTKGFKFSTYSTYWIREHITRFIAIRAQSVKVPDREYLSLLRALKDSDNDSLSYNDLPENQKRILALTNQVSLDMSVGDSGTELIDLIDDKTEGPETDVVERDSRKVIHQIINDVLNQRERAWLIMYYGLDGEDSMTMNRVANLSGVSFHTVKSVIENATQKLRSNESIQELGKADY